MALDEAEQLRAVALQLLPALTALENVMLPLEIMGHGPAHFRLPLSEMGAESRAQLRKALEQAGINVSAEGGRPLRAAR